MTTDTPTILRRFIVLEGVDGAGTTTQLANLAALLERKAVPHWITSEPTEAPEGRILRRILGGELKRDPGTVARLFAADRNEHLHGAGGIVERLGRGETVICDRYVFSSLAYQGVDCGPELPAELNEGFPLPELLLYFDVEPSISMKRIGDRATREIYEHLPFQEKVRAEYEAAMTRFSASGMKTVRIDASAPQAKVREAVLGAVCDILGLAP